MSLPHAQDVELQSELPRSTEHDHAPVNDTTEIERAALPPTDGGKAAWLVLAACSLIQAPVWGFSLAFGVLQEYYSDADNMRKDHINGNLSSIAVIGTTATGLLYLSSPFTFYVLTRYPHLRQTFGPLGLILSTVAYLLSSFATEIWQLILTQGVLGSLGAGLLFAPSTLYLDEWWLRRKGLAYGTMWAGKSLVGAVMPFAFAGGLERLGSRWMLRIWCGVVLLITAPLLPFLRPRRPPHHRYHHNRRTTPLDTSFLRLRCFWALQTGNILQSLGYFLPTAYLPSYTSAALHTPAWLGPLLLALLNGTSILGSFALGLLNDRMRPRNVVGLSAAGSAAAVLLCWGVGGRSVAAVVLFGVLYGFFAGGFSSTWAGVLKEVGGERAEVDTGLVFGLLAGGRGVGNVVSGPLSVVLLEGGKAATKGSAGGGFGTEYGLMIVFTGMTAVLGGWGWFSRCSVQTLRGGARRLFG